jgi:hypothetical protein
MEARASVRAAILILTAGFLLLHTLRPTPAQAAGVAEQIANTSFDVVILRPLGICATAVGAALFLPAVVVTLPNGKAGIDQAWERFVLAPVESTFTRKLGEW